MPETRILGPEPKCTFVIKEHDDGTVVLIQQYRGSPNATSTRLMGLLATKVLSVVREVMGLVDHWATVGSLPPCVSGVTVLPGRLQFPVLRDDKHHQTGKPTECMRAIAKIAPENGVVLDPFAGSGTTGVGALLEGRRAILVEMDPEIAEVAIRRCEEIDR